jgi:pimeloyl-ACP methyl ester carboxylesterase
VRPHNVGHFESERARAHFLSVYRTAMAQLPPVSESTDVPTSFGTVRAYRFDGPSAGPLVVLLPGRNASTPMWRVNIPALLEQRTVIGIDLLGEAGMSVQDKPITGPDDEAQWLDDALAGLGLGRAHLLGVSIGGWTAVNYAVRRPGRAASVALLDPGDDVRAYPGQSPARVCGNVLPCAGALAARGVQLDIRGSRRR